MEYQGTIDMANYNCYNDDEKNEFFLKYIGKPLKDISPNTKLIYTYLSVCVYMYLNASKEEKEILWNMFKHPLVRYYCDPDKEEKCKK